MNRRVTVVVLCWNRWALTRRCLETLRRHTDLSSADVLVVDNGSTDETPARLRELDWLKVVTLPKNLGYVRGNNAGIEAAAPGSDVLLLNNDVEIREDGWLDRLRETAHSAPDVGVVGCRLVLPDGRLLHAGAYILPETFWGQQIGSLETDLGQFTRTREVQAVTFACAYLRRELLDRIGPLSLDYESYFEDTDTCLRAREAGFRVLCCGDVTIVHHEHGSTSDSPELFDEVFQRSRATFSRRWKGPLESRYRYGVHWQSVIGIAHGYGMTSREMLRGLDERGLRMTYSYVYGPGTPVPIDEPENTGDYYLNVVKGRKREARPAISVVYGQGDVFRSNAGKYRVGYTMLEVDGFPDEWVKQANEMDEVWVPSQANRDAFVRCGVTRPVYVMPLGVNVDRFHPGVPGHRNPHGDFVFLTSFEWGERKAPGLLLRVFNETFRRNDPVVLVCKVNNRNGGLSIRREIEALHLKTGGGRIAFVFNRELPYAELPAFYRSGDCYVSPSHGEGWDMPLMEAMACGLPSIATDWGAHTEFVNADVAYPLRCKGTIPAVALCPYYKGFSWANPDPDHLAELFHHVVENREEAAEVGRRAAEEVARRFTVGTMVARLEARLDEIAGAPASGARA
ncbi:MAG: glycosyltransferase, partial [Acidobacteria bacterium ACB2]|nr:glycosyltransferase [Acidobacteria bacterium ACB2]